MNDNMSAYSGVAQSYRNLPLIALRELESVLKHEIYERECSFGMHKDNLHELYMHKSSDEKLQGSQVSVGEVEGKETVVSGGKGVNKGVIGTTKQPVFELIIGSKV